MTAWKLRKRRLPKDRTADAALVDRERSNAMKVVTILADAGLVPV